MLCTAYLFHCYSQALKPRNVPPRKHDIGDLLRGAVEAHRPAVGPRAQVTQRRVVIFHAIGVKSGLQEYLHHLAGGLPPPGERDWINFDDDLEICPTAAQERHQARGDGPLCAFDVNLDHAGILVLYGRRARRAAP